MPPSSDAQCPPADVDVLFVLDHSGSISDNDDGRRDNWVYMTDMIAEVVRTTARFPGIRYGAISYGSTADLEFNLDRYTQTSELVVAFRRIRNTGGNTNTTGALRLARTDVFSSLADRPGVRDVLVLITDGVPSLRYEAAGLLPEANRLKNLGIRLIGVGVTTAVDSVLMREIVSLPVSENYFPLPTFAELSSIIESLVECITSSTSSTSTTTTTTTATTTISFSTLFEPSPATPTTMTTASTTTTLVPLTCRHQADICILLDASGGGMDVTQFNEVVQFLVEMLSNLRVAIESGAVRFSLVRFADEDYHSFHLRTYASDFTGLIDAVRTTGYIGGGTNTGIGLLTLHSIDHYHHHRRRHRHSVQFSSVRAFILRRCNSLDSHECIAVKSRP